MPQFAMLRTNDLVDIGNGLNARLLRYHDTTVRIYAHRRMRVGQEWYWHTDACIGFGGHHVNALRSFFASVHLGPAHAAWMDGAGGDDQYGSFVNLYRSRGLCNTHFIVPHGKGLTLEKGRMRLCGWTVNIEDADGNFIQGLNHRIDDSGDCAFFLLDKFLTEKGHIVKNQLAASLKPRVAPLKESDAKASIGTVTNVATYARQLAASKSTGTVLTRGLQADALNKQKKDIS